MYNIIQGFLKCGTPDANRAETPGGQTIVVKSLSFKKQIKNNIKY